MPGEFYKKEELEADKAEFERQESALQVQIDELTAEQTAITAKIATIDSVLAHIAADYPTITTLGTPANLTAVAAAAAGVYTVDLNWDNVASATNYRVERSLYSDFREVEEIYSGATSAYLDNDADLTHSTTYYYRVKATAAGFNDSAWASITVPVYEQLPEAQNILLANTAGSGIVTGTWDEVQFAQSYEVSRHDANDFASASLIDTVATEAFSDNTVVNSTQYWYWIIAKASNFLDSDPAEGGDITPAP